MERHLHAAYSKRRREDVLELRPSLALALKRFLANRMRAAPAFRIPTHWRSAEMIEADLVAAKIP